MQASDAPPPPSPPTTPARQWYFKGTALGTLVHGVQQTDDRDFLAICEAGTGTIAVRLTQAVPWLSAGGYATVSITSGGKSLLYVARGVMDDNLGVVVPVIAIPSGDVLFTQMTSGTDLTINIGADAVYTLPLKGAGAPVRSLIAGCLHK
jgi:hypothetical protein